MNRILSSISKKVSQHRLISTLVLLVVLSTPLAWLDPVQTAWDYAVHTAVIEGQVVYDESCMVTELDINQSIGSSQNVDALIERTRAELNEPYDPFHPLVHFHTLGELEEWLQSRSIETTEELLQALATSISSDCARQYAIRVTQGRSPWTWLGQPTWAMFQKEITS